MESGEDDLPIVEPEQEITYTYREKQLRDLFINEYLVDYDVVGAAVRVGYGKSYAATFGARFMNEPYVMREIRRKEGLATNDSAEDKEAFKKRIIAGLVREANYRGPGASQSARVAALAKLASLNGMDPTIRSATELTGKDGQPLGAGTFVIPGIMTPEQWEQAAAAQQEALTSSTAPTLN